MSYNQQGRGGSYRKRYNRDRDDYDDRRPIETPDDKLKANIIKYGEVDPVEELERLEEQIRNHMPRNIPNLAEALLVSVTEQPYKIPFYAALIRLLHNPSDISTSEEQTLGRLILEEFWRGFQAYLDKVAWRETRLCVQFFAHLTVAKVISVDSMITMLRSFTAVLDEFGVSHGRAKKAALCAGDGLIIAGPSIHAHAPNVAQEIIEAIQNYTDTTTHQKWLVSPLSPICNKESPTENHVELLDALLNALTTLRDTSFEDSAICVPQPYNVYPTLDSSATRPYDLPLVLVPPEAVEMDSDSDEDVQVKKEEWPEYFIRLFPNDVSPDYTTPAGYVIRAGLLDTVDIFEVNRKDCARLLLEYPKWCLPGTFKPKPGAPTTSEPVPGKDWQLESTVIETVLGTYFLLPEAPRKSIYYVTLITELCKLSPSTVGPAVGKSIRKIYNSLSDGMDVEVARRFAEWFAVHMSNFGFAWVWKEWIPDLSLTVQHPRRAFMRRAIEFEVRLAYHDRILKTLPETMQVPDAYVIAETAPSPAYEYEDPATPHHDAAQAVLNLLRGRARVEDVITHLEALKGTLETNDEANVDSLVRSVVVHSLLHIGSRSFSHFLNAIERYLQLLKNLSNGSISNTTNGANVDARADILSNAAAFWKHNRQMVGIVFDKFMQYQIVDPTDVVGWTFTNGISGVERGGPMSLSAFEWDLLRAALDKANGRVTIAKKKVIALKKEDDDMRARVKAKEENMEVDVEAKVESEAPSDNVQLSTATKALSSLTKEQKAVFARTLDGFTSTLIPTALSTHANPGAQTIVTQEGWANRANWGGEEWNAWETWAWYRQFCRAYSPYLRTYTHTLQAVSLSKLEGNTDVASEAFKMIWNITTGQEA
ncbi:MIF4G like-domain-containing protein [Crepidotus variabilis]|uniref:MIF4G like-domain-containing protein n=1 Tax=Crepidotus variabilis TaxID=179855 RepID=A0A9P6EBF3_9AGAR|nr:MIF4G like-domain-containing protein [Crepidotus variabilis]